MDGLGIRYVPQIFSLDFYPYFFFKRFYSFIFRERGKEGTKEVKDINVWLHLMCPLLGTWPATQTCAVTEN